MDAETTRTELIVEDLLLLLFDSRTGTIAGEGSTLFHALAGGVLVDLAFDGSIAIEGIAGVNGAAVQTASPTPPHDRLLHVAWDLVVHRPVAVQTLILQTGPRLREPVIDRLVERGHLRRERHRILGLIPTTRLCDGGTARRTELLTAVRAVLVDGTEPDTRTGALVALLSGTGSLPSLHADIPWSGEVQARGKKLEGGGRGATAVAEAVQRTVHAINTTNLFVTLTVLNNR